MNVQVQVKSELSKQVPPIEQFAEYDSWEDYFVAIKKYCDETFQPFVKSSSKKVVTHNKISNLKHHFPEDMYYYYYKFRCKHHGEFQSKGLNQRNTK